ncbi:hypothetical protein Purlil1_407 [Purpureocillium lilacinum]|uniref:Tat pathway signal sequence n=1 Tax=Purpureocillium lilacinum TaxID=33203 RepID=A0ABR0CIG9_PURLI|nr:hypothetical protein Purlil1_407 [Purpureocillium lilacinum]
MPSGEKAYTPLYSDNRSSSSLDDLQHDAEPPTSLTRRAGPWILHLVLILAYSTIFALSTVRLRTTASVFDLVDSPANTVGDETHLEIFPIQGPPHGIYTGEPRPEVDEAWRDLLQCKTLFAIKVHDEVLTTTDNNIRVSDAWVHRWGREHEAVKLPDGGYLGMLSVFHELHCIKRLYQSLSPDYYFPNATKRELAVNREHNQHCLEVLRMGATCRGDPSIITHMWTDINALPIVNQTAPHQCVDFKKVMEYSQQNSVDVYQENYIVHPKFGASFPHGHSIKPFKEQEDMHE